MKKVSLVIAKYLQKNAIFNTYSELNRDDIFDKYINLKDEFIKYNYDLSTNDINSIAESDIVLYFDTPGRLPKKENIHKSYLVLVESDLIRPDNYDKNKHKFFNKIFTWHDDLVDNKKYFKLNFAHLFPKTINKDLIKKEKLCMLISGNKNSPIKDKRELYSKRKEAIRWFEKNHSSDFDLYGMGWDKYRFSGVKVIRAFNRVPFVPELFAKITKESYSSYKGVVENKKEVMQKYKFSICYENAKDIPGYITEKIFDSFFAGCVPVYWGANNITDYIPKECFIDKRDFKTYEELYMFLTEMQDGEYIRYLINIENYLNSKDSLLFTGKGFAKKLVVDITGTQND